MNKHFQGVLFCLIATVAWGGMFPVMGHALRFIDPFSFTLLRYAAVAPLFVALLLAREGRQALHLRGQRPALAWLLGSAGFAGFGFLVFWGQQMAGPSGVLTASIIMATQPMLGLLVNWRLRGVVPHRVSLVFVGLSFFGVALVVTGGDLQRLLQEPLALRADGLILLGAVCWVVYTVGGALFPAWSPYKYTAVTTVLGLTTVAAVVALLVLAGVLVWPAANAIVHILPGLGYMALVAGFVAVLAWNLGNRLLGSANAVLFMDVIPLTAFLVSSLQGATPSGLQVTGALFTAGALVANNLFIRRQNLAAQRAPINPQPRHA